MLRVDDEEAQYQTIAGAIAPGRMSDALYLISGTFGDRQRYVLNVLMVRKRDYQPLSKSRTFLPTSAVRSNYGLGCLLAASDDRGIHDALVQILPGSLHQDSLKVMFWNRRSRQLEGGGVAGVWTIRHGNSIMSVCATPFTPMLSSIAYQDANGP